MRESEEFVSEFLDKLPGKERALEAGAGIGRDSKAILVKHFDKVDLQEQNEVQIAKARDNVPFVDNFYQCGFQDF